jgi:uroporphyrinogen III methyltransferase/synthase
VVNLREELQWFENRPLWGKKIVVTRSRAQASRISKSLLQLGADVIEFPTLDIVPSKDMTELYDAIEYLDTYDRIIFTSQNAVNIFFDELFKKGKDVRALGSLKIAAIGPATAD